jgi:hypothetical protein
LADQAFNTFSVFPEDALKRIKPGEIKKAEKSLQTAVFLQFFKLL